MPERRFFRERLLSKHEALWARAKRITFASGATLFNQGDPATELFCMDRGRLKLWRAAEDGTALTLGYYDGGEVVGAVAIMQDRPHAITATAVTDSVVFAWPASLVRRLIQQDPALAIDLAVSLADRAEGLINRVEELSSTSVEARAARALTRLSARFGEDGEGGPVTLAITQREIADLAFSTVPTVSRLLKRWRAAGIVGVGRGRLAIRDMEALCALRGGDG